MLIITFIENASNNIYRWRWKGFLGLVFIIELFRILFVLQKMLFDYYLTL